MAKVGRVLLLLPVLLMILGMSSAFGQPSVALNASFTAPDYLGQSMTVWVEVENQASLPMQVQSVMVSFDWYNTLTGNTPRTLQAGEKSTWEFDNVQIPSTTWTGKHSFDASIMVGWADKSGGWSNTLSSPLHSIMNFGVQEAPLPPTTTVSGAICITTTGDGFVAQECSNPTTQVIGVPIATGNPISGFPVESISLGLLLGFALLVVGRKALRRN
jgi:hypothetical protein